MQRIINTKTLHKSEKKSPNPKPSNAILRRAHYTSSIAIFYIHPRFPFSSLTYCLLKHRSQIYNAVGVAANQTHSHTYTHTHLHIPIPIRTQCIHTYLNVNVTSAFYDLCAILPDPSRVHTGSTSSCRFARDRSCIAGALLYLPLPSRG